MKKQNCAVILSKGPRKGEECGRTHCRHSRYLHENKKQKINVMDNNIRKKRQFNLQLVRNRKTDLQNRTSQVLIDQADKINNVPFTKQDREKKLEIFGVQNERECFVTGVNTGVGRGDHIKEIRGYSDYYRKNHKYEGFIFCGSNTDWNTAPVSIAENTRYKKMLGKDIGRDELTDAEYDMCTGEQKQIHDKLREWEEYVTSKGAKMYQLIPDEIDNDTQAMLDVGFEFFDKAMNIICEKHMAILMDEDERIHGDFERKLDGLKRIIQSFDVNDNSTQN